jgi:hypothetical protein
MLIIKFEIISKLYNQIKNKWHENTKKKRKHISFY